MPAIFISHSSHDGAAADEIKSWLAAAGFDRVFLDFDKDTGIGAGEAWERRLYEEVARCHAVILVLTPNWLSSTWCRVELAQARALGKVIVPVIVSALDQRVVLPEIQAVDLVDWNEGGLQRIAERLHAITDELARGFTLDPHRPPYPGIHAFEAEDAAIFFGRDDEIRGVIERLEARRSKGGARLVLIIGASGAGKSSVLKAGVLPQLARRRDQWIVLPAMRPEKAPLEALAKTLAERQGDAQGAPQGWRGWHERLCRGDGMGEIAELAKDLRVGAARGATVLLPIDQLEELFTIAEPDECAGFVGLLTGLLDPARDLPVMAVATGRADVLQGLLESSGLAPLIDPVPLLPMPLDRVPRLIEGPATVASLIIEPGLSEHIARDVETAEALPLLAQMLRLLHDRCSRDKRLTLAAYQALGDAALGLNPVQNSVRLAADEAIAALRPNAAELEALRDAFIPHLVRLRLDEGRRVRQPAPLTALPPEAARPIRALTEARLLVLRTEDGEPVVEVAHEALFAAWPTLARWLDEEQQFLADIERVKSAAAVWAEAAAPDKPRALLQGLLLANAREAVLRHPQRFRGGEMERLRGFIAESAAAADAAQARAERLRRRVLQATLAASVILLLASLVSLWLYLKAEDARRAEAEQTKIAQQQRDRAEAAQLTVRERVADLIAAAAATQIALGNSDTGLRLAVHGARLDLALGRELRSPSTAGVELAKAATRGWRVLLHHEGAVSTAAFSRDGAHVLTAAEDGTAKLWDLATGQELMVLRGRKPFNSAVFTLDGKRIITAAKDAMVQVWDAGSGAELLAFDAARSDHALGDSDLRAFLSGNGTRIITVAEQGNADLWDIKTGLHLGSVDGFLDLSADGAVLAKWPLGENAITLLDTADMKQIGTVKPDAENVLALRLSPDGSRSLTVVNNSQSETVAQIWASRSGQQLSRLQGYQGDIVHAAFNPDGTYIATASGSEAAPRDSTVRLWNTSTGEQVAELRGHTPLENYANSVWSLSFSPDGQFLATASADRTVRFWQVRTPNGLGVSSEAAAGVLTGHRDWVTGVVFSPDSKRVLSNSRDGTARVWDMPDSSRIAQLHGHTGTIAAIAFSPDGTRVVTAGDDAIGGPHAPIPDKEARIWDAITGKQLGVLIGHGKGLTSALFDPTGKRILTASDDGTARIWDASNGRQITVLTGHSGSVLSAVFCPESSQILTAAVDRTVRVWDPTSFEQIRIVRLGEEAVDAAAFSPDCRRVATVSRDKGGQVRDLRNGSKISMLGGRDRNVASVEFSPDGRQIVTIAEHDVAQIWDSSSGEEIYTLQDARRAARFSADGRRIATAGPDGKGVLILDAASGSAIFSLPLNDYVKSVAFSPDGTRLGIGLTYFRAEIRDVHLATMSATALVSEACQKQLKGISTLSRDEMQLVGYGKDRATIDVCIANAY